MKFKKYKERSSIILPPLVLLLVGVSVYILVIKLTAPEEKVVSVTTNDSIVASQTPTPTPLQNASTPAIQLDIPKYKEEDIARWQSDVDEGRELWRTNPLEVVEQTAGQYGFLIDDPLTLVLGEANKPPNGQATVLAVNNEVNYEITLSQPGVVGGKGVWVITDINRVD